jgi:hypothetical protein
VPFIEKHINFIFDTKGQANILQKLNNPTNFTKIRKIIKLIDLSLLDKCADFSVCSSKEIAPFYWTYKRNFHPWLSIENFVAFMSNFKKLFYDHIGGLYCDIPDEMMFSLVIVFYFDRQIHS